jgi:hypothetical protein
MESDQPVSRLLLSAQRYGIRAGTEPMCTGLCPSNLAFLKQRIVSVRLCTADRGEYRQAAGAILSHRAIMILANGRPKKLWHAPQYEVKSAAQ